jgi:two-component system osmolarity sensor histidine kinase EnvZ
MMLSGISHDLRTPLTRLRLGLSMLSEGAAEAEDIAEMERDVAEMEVLIDAFLQFARSEAEADPVPTDPAALAAGAVEKARRAGGAVELSPLPAAASAPMPLRALSVERALGNLIGNAMRYADRAVVTVSAEDGTLRFTVEDDGPGIPESLREEALRPFARLDAARNQDRGTGVGLGLAIAQEIARAHGGRLQLSRSDRLGGLRADLVLARPGGAGEPASPEAVPA